jgi:fatty acid desaturase
MKSLTKTLITILVITTLIPIFIASECLFDQARATEFFGLGTRTADIEKIFFVMGGFVLSTTVMPILSIVWLVRKKAEGFTLAYLTGLVALVRGMLTFISFRGHDIHHGALTVTPMVVGLVILLLTFAANKQQLKTST